MRTKRDFAFIVKEVVDRYPVARKLYMVLINLNTRFAKHITETFGKDEWVGLSRIEFHHTPKHAVG